MNENRFVTEQKDFIKGLIRKGKKKEEHKSEIKSKLDKALKK